MVVGRVVGVLPVVVEMAGQQHGHHVGRGHAGSGMTGAGGGAAADRVHPQLLGQLANVGQGMIRHGGLLPGNAPEREWGY
jgi:hypothetical protein